VLDDEPSDWWRSSGLMTRYPDRSQYPASPERFAAATAAAAAAAATGRIIELTQPCHG